MSEFAALFLGAAVLLLYGAISRRQVASYLTGPMLFVAIGAAAGFALQNGGPRAADISHIRLLGELTLAIVLFTDSAHLKPKHLLQEESWPARMLFIGLPLVILAGAALAYVLFPGWPLWLAVLAGLILSPTDAALGRFILEDQDVPEPLRETLNAESGLNDGFALPPILILLAFAGGGMALELNEGALTLARHLVLGPLCGIVLGFGGGKLIDYAARRGWMQPLYQRLVAPALAVLAYAGAELVHANGFIAAYVAGLMIPLTVCVSAQKYLKEFSQTEAELLTLIMFFLFGVLIVPLGAEAWSGTMVLYALASLTIIRIVPIVASLAGTGLGWRSKGILAWFGPRGIASILYLLLAFETLGPSNAFTDLAGLVSLTVLLSIYAHGLSAVPLARAYAAHAERIELPLRRPRKKAK